MVKIKSESLQLVEKCTVKLSLLIVQPVSLFCLLLCFSAFNPTDYPANSGNRQEAWNGEGKDPAEGTGRKIFFKKLCVRFCLLNTIVELYFIIFFIIYPNVVFCTLQEHGEAPQKTGPQKTGMRT